MNCCSCDNNFVNLVLDFVDDVKSNETIFGPKYRFVILQQHPTRRRTQ